MKIYYFKFKILDLLALRNLDMDKFHVHQSQAQIEIHLTYT